MCAHGKLVSISSTQNKVVAILMYMTVEACLVMGCWDELKQELRKRLLLNQNNFIPFVHLIKMLFSFRLAESNSLFITSNTLTLLSINFVFHTRNRMGSCSITLDLIYLKMEFTQF